MKYISDFHTVQQAKEYLQENIDTGVECPCCGQFAKIYKHRLNSQIAKTLIGMYTLGDRSIHILNELKPSNRMYSLARFWGLIEPTEVMVRGNKKASGYWKLTEKGKLFVEDKETIAEYVLLFNNKHYGFKGDEVDIKYCLGKKFNYQELMTI